MKDSKKAILFLIFFAPFVGEGLSTSTPVYEWLNPLVIILLVFLYGFGALIIRELLIRWGKGSEGWLTLLLLGAAYGIIEEGLYLMTFFNPNWQDIGILGYYGRFIGVNWVWVVQLTIFHMIYSITIPVVLTHIAFPGVKEESWLSKKALIFVIIIFILCGPIWMLFVIDTYTKRIFSRLGFTNEKIKYSDLQKIITDNLEKDAALFNEYHALLVELGKNYCKKKPVCTSCPLNKLCKKIHCSFKRATI